MRSLSGVTILAARGVVLRVGAEDERDVELQAHGITLNLHIAFLHDVEEGDLNFAGEVGQLVHGEDAAIGARQQAIVHGELVREIGAGARGLDGIEIADEIGDSDIGRGEFFRRSDRHASSKRWGWRRRARR